MHEVRQNRRRCVPQAQSSGPTRIVDVNRCPRPRHARYLIAVMCSEGAPSWSQIKLAVSSFHLAITPVHRPSTDLPLLSEDPVTLHGGLRNCHPQLALKFSQVDKSPLLFAHQDAQPSSMQAVIGPSLQKALVSVEAAKNLGMQYRLGASLCFA